MHFKIKVISATGETITKDYYGQSAEEVKKQVIDDGYFPVEIHRAMSNLKHKALIKTSSMIVFNQELLTMLKAGIPLLQSLELLSSHGKDDLLRKALLQTVTYLKEGMSLSKALETVGVFPKVYLANIVAGERSGTLPDVIARWLDFQTFAQKNRSRIVEALVYPMFLAVVMVAAIIVIVNVVLPKFAEIYADSSAQMPLATRALLKLGEFMRSTIYIQGVLLIGLIWFIRWLLVSELGNKTLDRFISFIPKLGTMYNMYHSSIFARTLSILLAGGMPVMQALEVIQKTAISASMRVRLNNTIELVRSGSSLYLALGQTKLLHPLATEMTRVGEQSSSLPEMLNYVADFFDQETAKVATIITTLIGPVMILIMGVMVMGLLLAVYIPLFNIGNIAQ